MTWDPSALALRLREAMAARGCCPRELGELAGIHHNHVLQLGRGAPRKRGPTLSTVEALASALDVSPAWLAWGVE